MTAPGAPAGPGPAGPAIAGSGLTLAAAGALGFRIR